MAVPLTPDQLVRALRAEGVTVVEVPGWRQNNRNHKGLWGPVHGTMLHHTVTPKTMSAVPLCFNGHSELPGPLCHGVIRRNGEVHLVGNGRANHAGGGDPDVLQAVIAENYGTRPPAPNEHQGSPGAVDGNAVFWGWECENEGDGDDPWPAVQVEAMVRVSAALCRAQDWGAKSTIGHLEWSDWKNDPRGPDNVVSMPGLRLRIAERLLHPANWNPGTTPKPPAPKPPVENNVAISDADIKRITLAVQGYRNAQTNQASIDAGHGRIPDAYGYTTLTHGLVTALIAEVKALRTEVAALRRESGR